MAKLLSGKFYSWHLLALCWSGKMGCHERLEQLFARQPGVRHQRRKQGGREQPGGQPTLWRHIHVRWEGGGGGEVGAGPHYTHHLFLSEKKPLKGTCFKGKTKLFYKLFFSSFSSENFSCLGLVLLIANSSCMRRIVSSAEGWRGFWGKKIGHLPSCAKLSKNPKSNIFLLNVAY